MYYYFYCLLFLRVLCIVSLDEVGSLLIDFTSSIVSSSSHTILELCQRKPLIDVLSTDGTIPENTLVGNISSS